MYRHENDFRIAARPVQFIDCFNSVEDGHGYVCEDYVWLQSERSIKKGLTVTHFSDNLKHRSQQTFD
jgi:hypothetical protein